MGIELTDRVRENARRYGIDPEGITDPSAYSWNSGPLDVSWNRPTLTLYRGEYLSRTGPDHYVILVAEEGEVASGAHIVPADILYQDDHHDPGKMLERLAYHGSFGLGVEIGGAGPFSFLTDEVITLAEPGTLFTPGQPPPEGHEEVVEGRADFPYQGEARVSLAFAIDATAVREHLGLG